jgi:hypothetical protein
MKHTIHAFCATKIRRKKQQNTISVKKPLPIERAVAPRPEQWTNGNSTAVLAPTHGLHPAALSFGVGVTAAGGHSSTAAPSGSAHYYSAESAVDIAVVAVVVGETIKAIDGRWALGKDTVVAAQALAQRGERLRVAVFCLLLFVLVHSLQL